jgi:hypothetical protein
MAANNTDEPKPSTLAEVFSEPTQAKAEPEPTPEPDVVDAEAEEVPTSELDEETEQMMADWLLQGPEFVLDAVEALNRQVFTKLSKNKLMSGDKLRRARAIAKEKDKDVILTEEQVELLAEYRRWQDLCDDVELSDEERENILKPLRLVLAKMKLNPTPEAALILAAAMAFAPSYIDLYRIK